MEDMYSEADLISELIVSDLIDRMISDLDAICVCLVAVDSIKILSKIPNRFYYMAYSFLTIFLLPMVDTRKLRHLLSVQNPSRHLLAVYCSQYQSLEHLDYYQHQYLENRPPVSNQN